MPDVPLSLVSSPPLWLVERLLRRFYVPLGVAISIAVVVNEVEKFGADLNNWDWLWVSTFGIWLAGVYFSLFLPDKLTETLTRLANRDVLNGDGNLAELLVVVNCKARRSALSGAVVSVIVIVIAWAVAYQYQLEGYVLSVILQAIVAVPVGLFAGRSISYGRLSRRLGETGFTLTPDPDHFDGAAGMRPIGAFYFYQSGLLAIPGAFLAVWWFLIPFFGDRYLVWRGPYMGLLFIIVICQFLGFILPMRSFHHLMLNHKSQLFRQADELSRRAARARPDVATHERWVKRYKAIESMVTWPTDIKIRRRFELRNVLLLMPVLTRVLGGQGGMPDLLESIRKIFSG